MDVQSPTPGAVWIDHTGSLSPPTDHDPLGLDTEFMRRSTFYPKLALVQVAHADAFWLLDPQAFDAGTDLRALVAGRTCLMHSASEDLEALAPLLGDVPLTLFDTQIAAALCGMGAGLSYQKLVAEVCGVDVPKDETCSDWLQRPLTAGQLQYAARDVAYLEPMHEHLASELQRRGRSAWHAEDCARLVEHAHRNYTQIDPQPQRGFPGAAEWPAAVQVRLKRALLWRDRTARQLDRPRPWLLDDARALSLAQQPPIDAQALFERVKGLRALRGPQRTELLAVLQAPIAPEELADLAPIPPPPRGETRHAVGAMREIVHAAAAKLELPPGLLCPRRLIEDFASTRIWPADLAGWRAQVLQAPLTALLPS